MAIEMAALHLGLEARGHAVVAEIVEAELGVRAVGDIAGVLGAAHGRRLVVLDAADGEAEKLVHFPHPLGVARGEVIVHRHQMGVAGERVQVQRHGGDERLAFARRHFRDPAVVQGDPAEDLHVKWDHVPFVGLTAHGPFPADKTTAGVLYRRERLGQQIVQCCALGEPLAEFVRFRAELLVGELLVFRFDFVDAVHHRPEPFYFALVLRTQQFSSVSS